MPTYDSISVNNTLLLFSFCVTITTLAHNRSLFFTLLTFHLVVLLICIAVLLSFLEAADDS